VSWLGENTDGIADVLIPSAERDNLKTFFEGDFACKRTRETICTGCCTVLSIWKVLAEILNCKCWHRLWIVQEIFLIKNLLLYVGKVQIPFKLFFDCCRTFIALKTPGLCIGNARNLKYNERLERYKHIGQSTVSQKIS
jgi:hypothetical protein